MKSFLLALATICSAFAQSPEGLISQTVSSMSMFRSKPAFMSWALRQVKNLEVNFESDVMVDSSGYGWSSEYNSESPSIAEMNETVAGFDISFDVSGPGSVYTEVSYRDQNYRSLFYGSRYFWTQQSGARNAYVIPENFGPEVRIAETIAVKLEGIERLQVTLNNEYGYPEENIWLGRDGQGYFNIPRRVIGNNGRVIATPINFRSNSDRFMFDINTGSSIAVKRLSGSVTSTVADAHVLMNATSIDIKPVSLFGRGKDLLVEATYTEEVDGVLITPVTTEGEIADTITIVDVVTGESRDYEMNPRNLLNSPTSMKLDFPVGRFHIYANWRNFKDDTDSGDGYYWSGGKG
jgi:hypothetical protein